MGVNRADTLPLVVASSEQLPERQKRMGVNRAETLPLVVAPLEQPLERRRRRWHPKSRQGCQTCKKQHVRCDQRKPMCSRCLGRGSDCVYLQDFISHGDCRIKQDASAIIRRPRIATIPQVLGGELVDPFETLDIDMPYRSNELLQHFLLYRKDLQRIIQVESKNRNQTLTSTFALHPALKRCYLLLSANCGNYQREKQGYINDVTCLHHKREAMQLIIEQMNYSPRTPGEWSYSSIFYLVTVEILAHETLAAEVHLKGLITWLRTAKAEERVYETHCTLLRTCFLTLSIIEASKTAEHDASFGLILHDYPDSPLLLRRNQDWADVAYALFHLTAEFLTKGEILLREPPLESTPLYFLGWLINAIRSLRAAQKQNIHGYSDPQQVVWAVAGACYALLIAGLAVSNAEAHEGFGKIYYGQFQNWWNTSLGTWLVHDGRLPSADLIRTVLEKVGWMTSPEGIIALEHLYHFHLYLAKRR